MTNKPHRGGVLASSPHLVRRHRRPHRTRPHRQRGLLPLTGLGSRPQHNRRDPQTHPPLPTPNQRQSRTVPPDPARGMGPPTRLDLRPATPQRLRRLPPLLQSPPLPRRPRLGNTHHHPAPPPPGQPPQRPQLGIGPTAHRLWAVPCAAGGRPVRHRATREATRRDRARSGVTHRVNGRTRMRGAALVGGTLVLDCHTPSVVSLPL